MNYGIISKENVLNEIVFTKNNFVRELLDMSLEINVITVAECKVLEDKVQHAVMNRVMEVIDEFAYDFDEFAKLLIPNYNYLISRYLYTMLPSDALIYLRENSGQKLLSKSVSVFQAEFSNKYFEVEKFMNNISGSWSGKYRAYLKEVLNYLKDFLGFESHPEKLIDLTEGAFFMSYITLNNIEISSLYAADTLIEYANAVMMEYNIRSKIGLETAKKIEALNTQRAKDIKELRDIRMEADEKEIHMQVEREVALAEKRGEKISAAEKQDMIDSKMLELDDKYAEYSFVEFEFENSLADIFVEFVCLILQMEEGIDVPKKNIDKHSFVGKLDKDRIFDIIFSHEELFDFSDEEKEYLKKYLIRNI